VFEKYSIGTFGISERRCYILEFKEEIIEKSFQVVKIAFTSAEKTKLKEDFKKIDQWMEPLLLLPTKDVEPTKHNASIENILRPDSPKEIPYRENLTRNSENFEEDFYRVPSIIEEIQDDE